MRARALQSITQISLVRDRADRVLGYTIEMHLRTFLHQNSISQADFASRSQVSQSTIARVCLGFGCHSRQALRIVEATGGLVTLADLAGRRPEAEREAAS